MDLAARIVRRFLEARKYTRPKNMVPVYNKDTERIVYVLPETLQEEGAKYEKVPPSKLDTEGKPNLKRPGQPHLPKKPQKPHKPEISRDPPPAPIHPPTERPERKPPKEPKQVKPVKAPKVPEPSPPPKYKKVRKYLYGTLERRIVEKFLDSCPESGV